MRGGSATTASGRGIKRASCVQTPVRGPGRANDLASSLKPTRLRTLFLRPRRDEWTAADRYGGRLAYSHSPIPSYHKALIKRTRATAEHEDVARKQVTAKALLHQQSQAIHTFPHVGVAAGNPDPDTCRDRDHRRCRMASTRPSAAASTAASRRTFPISVTMRPLARAPGSVAIVSAVATTALTKPLCCMSGPIGSGRKARRHVISNEREMP
jgi:hypothetical protein